MLKSYKLNIYKKIGTNCGEIKSPQNSNKYINNKKVINFNYNPEIYDKYKSRIFEIIEDTNSTTIKTNTLGLLLSNIVVNNVYYFYEVTTTSNISTEDISNYLTSVNHKHVIINDTIYTNDNTNKVLAFNNDSVVLTIKPVLDLNSYPNLPSFIKIKKYKKWFNIKINSPEKYQIKLKFKSLLEFEIKSDDFIQGQQFIANDYKNLIHTWNTINIISKINLHTLDKYFSKYPIDYIIEFNKNNDETFLLKYESNINNLLFKIDFNCYIYYIEEPNVSTIHERFKISLFPLNTGLLICNCNIQYVNQLDIDNEFKKNNLYKFNYSKILINIENEFKDNFERNFYKSNFKLKFKECLNERIVYLKQNEKTIYQVSKRKDWVNIPKTNIGNYDYQSINNKVTDNYEEYQTYLLDFNYESI